MGVKLQSSLGGSVEIAAPVTASNYVLTAPATTSTIDTLARPGNVLQVVYFKETTFENTTSTTTVQSLLAASITPSSSANKILVRATFTVQANSTQLVANLYRGTISGVFLSLARTGYTGATTNSVVTVEYLDSPSTTSSQMYSIGYNSTSGGAVFINPGTEGASITLMEIAG